MRLTYIHPITPARDAMPPDGASKKPNYNVKKIEAIAIGTDVQARLFTLRAPKLYGRETRAGECSARRLNVVHTLAGRDRTAWLTVQSTANRSPHQIPW